MLGSQLDISDSSHLPHHLWLISLEVSMDSVVPFGCSVVVLDSDHEEEYSQADIDNEEKSFAYQRYLEWKDELKRIQRRVDQVGDTLW